MIQISGMPFQPNGFNVGSIENEILQQMSNTRVLYSYSSSNELLFELNLRKNIIESAREMNNSQAEFTTFQYAYCNEAYWRRTSEGGFLLKSNVNPSDAILDIYQSSSQYAFECATACIIVFYHAVLKSIGKPLFNSLFQSLYLYSWHSDPDLGIYTYYGDHILPGDVVYFRNPDYNPTTSWYRGVNAVTMSAGTFFGHGVGIKSTQEMIEFLNKYRRAGSSQSAYLTRLVTNPSFKGLFAISTLQRGPLPKKQYKVCHHNKSSISFLHYLSYYHQQFNNKRL
ncbi:protein-glutamine gamma-glutamyltransferase [Bacillus luteolus]|uniref:Protein-glutamine gamma-glutamyltransferase n=1 Tax=Litchfieldia luteola TaxID=682179 RepID=A0ABR9QJ17_9BACI|nr:protein-glutamine gamma-glutamyltransferase [Cytobacillus luteolus]MBE4908493.1 protein-glutamine gamma-glutamyltransferase [Cytobacillus luteolus]MBP1941345.1 protein-glutamine gamma-glutamyltransferase [Cytobacillus luteolus]